MKPLQTLHVGVGNRGAHLLQLLGAHSDYQPMVLMDKSAEFLQAARDLTGLPESACFTDFEAALAAPGLDAAIINTPARFHGEQMRACIERGLPVFVAKPMTYDFREAVELVEAAERRGVAIVVDQQSQFLLTERTLAQWTREKKFGELGFGSFTIHRHRPEMRAFTGTDPFLWEQGVHSFNSLLAMTQRRAVAVQAIQMQPSWSRYNGPTVCMALLEFEDGARFNYLGTFDSNQFQQEIRFEFEQGAVRIASQSWQKEIFVAAPGEEFKPTGVRDADDPLPAERFNLDAFAKAIITGERVPNDGRDNLSTLAVCAAFLESAREGKRVLVPQTGTG